MAFTYNPTDWHTGDVITEGKLNNIEDGIKGLYPTPPEVIAPEQTITITSSTPMTGVPIQLAEGKSIDLDLLMAGGYFMTLSCEYCSLAFTNEFYPEYQETEDDDIWTGNFRTNVGSNYDEPYLPFSDASIIYNLQDGTLSFMVASTGLDIPGLIPYSGEYTVSITTYGMKPGTAIPRFLYDSENYENLEMCTPVVYGRMTSGSRSGDPIQCFLVNMENPINDWLIDGYVNPLFAARPIVVGCVDDADRWNSGWYITEPCQGVFVSPERGSENLICLIPDTTPIEFYAAGDQ